MNKYLVGFYYSLPIQLLLLHFRKYQVFLIFWFILFSTVNGTFMKRYGANTLYLAPEYLGNVNAISTSLVGFTVGVFVMSWNITTFILYGKFLKFLATTSNPFLKYCINNSLIPLFFLLFYLVKAVEFGRYQELLSITDLTFLIAGFVFGLILSISIAFVYFFSADKSIYRKIAPVIDTANMQYALASKDNPLPKEKNGMRIDWFLTAGFKLRKPRDVRHYSIDFLESIFKRHHLAAVMSIFIAFFFLLIVGFFLDRKIFQIPAAASVNIFFAILIAVSGAFSLFLKNWSIPVLICVYLLLNWMYEENIIDPRNKAYGLNYTNKLERPLYDRNKILELASDTNALADKASFIKILNNWKARQGTDKPVMYLINVSGGGNRSATFTMNVLQRLDSLTKGKLLRQTVLINGASGGVLGAAYFRELYDRRQQGMNINLQDKQYADDISKDLLNPLFSSFVVRDLASPAQRFRVGPYSYIKDRGYAFEQKLNDNTHGILNKQLKDYALAEEKAQLPILFFNSVISRDGRKMVISTHPARFLMKTQNDSALRASTDPDLIDFVSFFSNQNPYNLRILSALRMNATFPYVLPNVWLPTIPVIDVMDAGLRDNYGLETTLRFIQVFKEWLQQNTSKVVLIQIRDRQLSDWTKPYEVNNILSWLTKPLGLLQNNWFKLQDYYQADLLSYASSSGFTPATFKEIYFQYVPSNKEASASLSFHLTTSEKRDIAVALENPTNQQAFQSFMSCSNIQSLAKKE